ncbi:MAG: hypothetical protein ACRDRL_01690, partial [Sciscionella sp.]
AMMAAHRSDTASETTENGSCSFAPAAVARAAAVTRTVSGFLGTVDPACRPEHARSAVGR